MSRATVNPAPAPTCGTVEKPSPRTVTSTVACLPSPEIITCVLPVATGVIVIPVDVAAAFATVLFRTSVLNTTPGLMLFITLKNLLYTASILAVSPVCNVTKYLSSEI